MIRLNEIKVPVTSDSYDYLLKKVSNRLNVSKEDVKEIKIIKKSIDARNKSNILFNYELNISINNEDRIKNISKVSEEHYKCPNHGNELLDQRPIVVGSGPCGLFCSYILALEGYKPIVIERGEKIEDRVKTVDDFWNNNKLNQESNVCFGEGGAGTFSDGKLNTLVDDSFCRIKKVFETFVECGADSNILYINKPHIGTDVLRNVIINLRNTIIKLGGEFRYNSCLTDVIIEDNKLSKIIINNKDELNCNVLVLAIGHSARDTIEMLNNKKLEMEPKPFAVGLRIQHKQEMIDNNQYGSFSKYLPHASYKLTYKASNNRGVYTFCMCPGGYVVNSSCEKDHLIVNGMSNNARDSENANSAIVVTVGPDDFGTNTLDGLKFQRELEKKAYEIGNGKIPVQLLGDYRNNIISKEFKSINPVMKGDYIFSNLNDLFPNYINESIKEALLSWDNKINGFNHDDSILAGVESRTSSAIRIIRDFNFESNIKGIYPSGEGAGYSGGITTSAVDGIKTAEKIIEKYTNKNL